MESSSRAWDDVLAFAQHDVFHTAGYHRYAQASGEGEPFLAVVREGEKGLAWPYLLRPVADVPGLAGSSAVDVHSVYGYPGPITWGFPRNDAFLGDAWRDVIGVWRAQGAVSAFTRFHPLLENAATVAEAPWPVGEMAGTGGVVAGGPTVSVDLRSGAEAARAGYSKDLRREIASSRRRGLTTVHDVEWSSLQTFVSLYYETMVRSAASQYYFFGEDDFLRLRDELDGRLQLLVTSIEGTIAAAGLFTEFDGIAEWYLVGTSDEFRRLSPSKVLVDDAVAWAAERGSRVLHLGGGRGGREDTLLWFKGRFSPRRHPFHTGRWVLDRGAYAELVELRRSWAGANSIEASYFPTYRSPSLEPGIPPDLALSRKTPMSWHVIGPDDGAALGELLPRIDHTYFTPHEMTPEMALSIANRQGLDVYLLGFSGSTPVAYGMLRGWDEGYPVPSLGIGVRRENEREGLGRAMMLALHQVARERGASTVRLRVHPDNTGAAALYRSLGYQEAGIERAEILMIKSL